MRANQHSNPRRGFGLPGMLMFMALFVAAATAMGWTLSLAVSASAVFHDSGSRKADVRPLPRATVQLQ